MRRPTLSQVLIGQTILILVLVAVIAVLLKRGGDEKEQKTATAKKGANPSGGRGGWARSGRGGQQKASKKTTGSTSIPVKVTKVARRNIDASLWDSTWLEPETRVDVLTKSSGEIVKLNVEEGDSVKQGDILAEIECDKEQVEHNKAKVDVDSAKISIRNAEIALDKTRISYENCKALYDRAVKMYTQRVISSEDHDAKKLDCDKSKAECDKAEQDLEAAKLKLSTEELEMETARLNLEYTKIRSPISGVVTARGIERGQVVNNNYAAFRVADYDPIIANISVPETELSNIRIGGPVRVQAEAMLGKKLAGKVSLISPIAETGKVRVEVEIPNPPGLPLRPGMYATLHLVTETRENTLVIPKRALVIESDANEVFIAQDIVQIKVPAEQQEAFKVDAAVRIVQKVPVKSTEGEEKPKEDQTQTSSNEPAEEEKTVQGVVGNVLPPVEEGESAEITIVLPDDHGLQKDLPAKVSLLSDGAGEAGTIDVESLEPRTRALKRKVDLGLSEHNDVEITKGLEEGERVVTAGNEELKNGSILLVVEVEAPSGKEGEKAAATPKKRATPGNRWGGGGMSPEFLERMKERVLSVPAVKAEYDRRVKADPALATDQKKFFKFMGEMRERGLIQPRRRRPE